MNYESYISTLKTKFKQIMDAEIAKINLARPDLAVPLINKYIDEYPDTVQNTENLVFYILPNEFNYEPLTNTTLEQETDLNVYLTAKGDNSANLKKIIYRYMEALHNGLAADYTLGGFVDALYITTFRFYDEIEGTQNYKAFEANIKLIQET